MEDLERRLTSCFQTVFPNVSVEDISAASMDTVEEWDSLKMMTLIVVLEEEYEIELPLDEIENLTTFQALKVFLGSA